MHVLPPAVPRQHFAWEPWMRLPAPFHRQKSPPICCEAAERTRPMKENQPFCSFISPSAIRISRE